jgi:hypothetical protein
MAVPGSTWQRRSASVVFPLPLRPSTARMRCRDGGSPAASTSERAKTSSRSTRQGPAIGSPGPSTISSPYPSASMATLAKPSAPRDDSSACKVASKSARKRRSGTLVWFASRPSPRPGRAATGSDSSSPWSSSLSPTAGSVRVQRPRPGRRIGRCHPQPSRRAAGAVPAMPSSAEEFKSVSSPGFHRTRARRVIRPGVAITESRTYTRYARNSRLCRPGWPGVEQADFRLFEISRVGIGRSAPQGRCWMISDARGVQGLDLFVPL